MKKLILVFMLLIITTGCDPNHDFTKVCKKETKSDDYRENVKTTINYNNKDEVTKVVIEKEYQTVDSDILASVKESSESFNKSLENRKGIEVHVSEDNGTYKITYTLLPQNMDDAILESFEIKRNSIKYFNYLKKNHIECS